MTTNFNNLIDPFRALLNYQPAKPQIPATTQARPVAQPTLPQTFQLGPINTGTPASFLSQASQVVPPSQRPSIPNYGTAPIINALPPVQQRAPIQNLALKPEAFGPPSPTTPMAPTSGYTIQRGDTLSAIADNVSPLC